ncbi:MAG: serine/threonine protein kinase [Ignavibacteriales bacterium]|jgi:serine/threonine protein kinase|nr:serine/threonine protein kinase [Ignavibacteriales bacterium]MBP9121974.1 serine/threonine protein kinase [Ignavibacteriaceae bacterium]
MFVENQIIKDEYRIIRKIGEGGMGTVFLAEDLLMQQEVAIKLLHMAMTTDPEIVERFKTEAKAQYKLTHPYIVKLTRLVQNGEHYFIVMEYVEGMTLKEMLAKTGLLPEDRALPIFHKILRGLAYAHSQGIIHRDIKPGNIIIDKNGNPKITDFGIAKILGDKGLTQTGTKLGTVYYMSPEQIKNPKGVDQRTDVYSLGITLYEMLTGKLPYNTGLDSEYDLMNEIVNTPIKNPLDFYPHISPGVVKMIYHMTSKDKLERYAHCEEYLDFHLKRAEKDEKQSAAQNVSSGAASFVLLLGLAAIVVLLFIFGNDIQRWIQGSKATVDSVFVNQDSIDRVEYERLQDERNKEKKRREEKDTVKPKEEKPVDTVKIEKKPVDEETIPPDTSGN